MTEKNVIDILLQNEIPAPKTRQIKIKRLSECCGEPVVFTLRELSFDRVEEIKQEREIAVHILLAGVVEPDLRNKSLSEKYKAATPADLVKKMLLPGEIEDISREIEKLSGYRTATVEAIKKK